MFRTPIDEPRERLLATRRLPLPDRRQVDPVRVARPGRGRRTDPGSIALLEDSAGHPDLVQNCECEVRHGGACDTCGTPRGCRRHSSLPSRRSGPVGFAVGHALVSANDPTITFVRFTRDRTQSVWPEFLLVRKTVRPTVREEPIVPEEISVASAMMQHRVAGQRFRFGVITAECA